MAREYNFYVYMLTNAGHTTLYIGVTNHLENRLHEHRAGRHPGSFTHQYKVSRLVYYEHFHHVFEALDREKQLKGWSRRKKEALIVATNPRWEDLSAGWQRYKDEESAA